MQDQSTNRQWSEGTSPLTQVREYPMTETIPYNYEINEILKMAPDRTQVEREKAATEVVEYRARIMGAGTAATAWGCLGARNAVKAGESEHRAIEIGTARVVDIMESSGREQ